MFQAIKKSQAIEEESFGEAVSPGVARDIAQHVSQRMDVFDEDVFQPDLFKGAGKQDNIIVAKGRAPEELVAKRRTKKKLGDGLSKLEQEALKK